MSALYRSIMFTVVVVLKSGTAMEPASLTTYES